MLDALDEEQIAEAIVDVLLAPLKRDARFYSLPYAQRKAAGFACREGFPHRVEIDDLEELYGVAVGPLQVLWDPCSGWHDRATHGNERRDFAHAVLAELNARGLTIARLSDV